MASTDFGYVEDAVHLKKKKKTEVLRVLSSFDFWKPGLEVVMPEQPCLCTGYPVAAPSLHRERVSPLEWIIHGKKATLPFPGRPPWGPWPPCRPVQEAEVRRPARQPSPPQPSPVKQLAGWIPTAASCQPGWQTNPWKSKYVYHQISSAPFSIRKGSMAFLSQSYTTLKPRW